MCDTVKVISPLLAVAYIHLVKVQVINFNGNELRL